MALVEEYAGITHITSPKAEKGEASVSIGFQFILINLNNRDYYVGTLWSHFNRCKETSEFEYSRDWLNNPSAFSFKPAMYLGFGKHHPTKFLF